MIKALRVVPAWFFEATHPIQMRFNELMTGIRQDVAVKIYGGNMDTLAVLADRIAGIVGEVQGAGEPQVEKVAGLPQITIPYQPAGEAQNSLHIPPLNRTVRTALAGEATGALLYNQRRFCLGVGPAPQPRQGMESVRTRFHG